jgi:hypothetical protein
MTADWLASTARRVVPAREAASASHNCRPAPKSSTAKSFTAKLGGAAIGLVDRYWSLAGASTSWIDRVQWASTSPQRRISSRM